MFFTTYNAFLAWHRIRPALCSMVALCVYMSTATHALSRGAIAIRFEDILWSSGSALVIFLALFISLALSNPFLDSTRVEEGFVRPRQNHPVWRALKALRAPYKVSVRQNPRNSFFVTCVVKGLFYTRRIILFVPPGATSTARNYAKRRVPILTAILAHEIGHSLHWNRSFIPRCLGTSLSLTLGGIFGIIGGSEVVSIFMSGNIKLMVIAETVHSLLLISLALLAIDLCTQASSRSIEFLADGEVFSVAGIEGAHGLIRYLRSLPEQGRFTKAGQIRKYLWDQRFDSHPTNAQRIAALERALRQKYTPR